MANFPTKTTGSQVLTPGDKQLLQWTLPQSYTSSYYTSATSSLVLAISPYITESTIIDKATGKTITVNGSAAISNSYPLFTSSAVDHNDTSAIYFDGTGDYLDVAHSTDFDFGTGDFTVEFWVYFTAFATGQDLIGTANNTSYLGSSKSGWVAAYYYALGGDSEFRFSFQDNSSWPFENKFDFDASLNRWYHVAYTREGTSLKCFVDGVQAQDAITTSTDIVSTEDYCRIGGGYGSTSNLHNGYIADLRLLKGTALYTGSFDKPTTRFDLQDNELKLTKTAGKSFYETDKVKSDANTVLHISPRVGDSEVIKDISMHNRSNTVTGTPFISSSMTVSGAAGMYFDGNGDWIEIPQSDDFAFTGDFTIEFWAWKSADGVDGYDVPLGTTSAAAGGDTGWFVEWSNSRGLWFYDCPNSTGILSFSTNPLDSLWHHIAIVRNSGVVKGYIDGVEKDSATHTSTMAAGDPLRVGASGDGSGYGPAGDGDCPFNGYLADIRVIKGTALYTSAFTPPSRQETVEVDKPPAMALHNFHPGGAVTFHHGTEEPSTPSANNYVLYQDTPDDQNTVLLMHMDGENSGTVFRDVSRTGTTGSHFITPAGTAQTSTAQSKFGGSSLLLDGNSDYLDAGTSADWDFGTSGDFTIEMWVYFNNFTNHNMLANQWSNDSGHSGDWQMFFRNTESGKMEFFYKNSGGSWASSAKTATAIAATTWTHIAVVRHSGTIKFYINGTVDSTTITDSAQIGDASKVVRLGRTLQPDHYLDGYVDEFRISKGIARYSGSFTPPTQPFGGGLRMKDPDGKIYALSLSGSA